MGKPLKRTPEVIALVLEQYKQTQSGNQIAKRLGLAPRTVYKVLHDAGIHVPGWTDEKPTRRKFDAETEAKIVADYVAGMSWIQLEKKYGSGQFAMRAAVRRAGLKLRDHGGQRRRVYDGEAARMVLLYQQGLSQQQIATLFEAGQTVVSRVLRKHGIKSRAGKNGSESAAWRGGITQNAQGYIMQHVERTSPFWQMASRSGYVMQHRLVMAQSLGRPLLDSESVHHINGDRTDNRIENLQLRQGKHGTGTVMCCADCGSQRIVHREIE